MDLAANGDNVYGVIYDSGQNSIILNRSLNAGYFFQPAIKHNAPVTGPIVLKVIPDRGNDGDDLYMLTTIGTTEKHLVIAKSINGGITWAFCNLDIPDLEISEHYSMAVLAGSAGHATDRIYISHYNAVEQKPEIAAFTMTVSPAAVQTLITRTFINNTPQSGQHNSIDVVRGAANDGTDDRVYISYQAENAGDSFLQLFKTYDRGVNTSFIDVDPYVLKEKKGAYSSIKAYSGIADDGSDDRIYIAYQKIDTSGSSLMFTTASDGGGTFSSPLSIRSSSTEEIGIGIRLTYSEQYVYISHYEFGTPGTIAVYRSAIDLASFSIQKTFPGVTANYAPFVPSGVGSNVPENRRLYGLVLFAATPSNLQFIRSLDRGNNWP